MDGEIEKFLLVSRDDYELEVSDGGEEGFDAPLDKHEWVEADWIVVGDVRV